MTIPATESAKLSQLTQPVRENDRCYRGFNFFPEQDDLLFRVSARGEVNIRGFQNKRLRAFLPGFSSGHISRLLKRLRKHGLVAGRCHKYYLTGFGRQVIALGLKLKNAQTAHR